MEKKKKLLTYKGKPLLKCGERVFYGYLDDKYILVLEIKDSVKMNDVDLSKKVVIKLMENTDDLGEGTVFRQGERPNLYEALDIGEWWLKQALKDA